MTRLVTLVGVPMVAVLMAGCSSNNGSDKSMSEEGKVTDRNQTQNVSPDNRTATQTRSQIRQTDEGAKVKETETRKREVLDSGGSQQPDPTNPSGTK
jgi:hypothetical protein